MYNLYYIPTIMTIFFVNLNIIQKKNLTYIVWGLRSAKLKISLPYK